MVEKKEQKEWLTGRVIGRKEQGRKGKERKGKERKGKNRMNGLRERDRRNGWGK